MQTLKNSIEISSYEKQANDFLAETQTTFSYVFKGSSNTHFGAGDMLRNIFRCTLKNANYAYHFDFGGSNIDFAEGKKTITAYDVLACLQKYEVGSFADFCSEFGYSQYDELTYGVDKKSLRVYNAICKEYVNICKLFTPAQIEKLQEIQ